MLILGVDLIPFVVTLVVCLTWSLEYGILIGVGVNLLFIIYASSRPQIRLEELTVGSHRVLLVEPDRSLPFAAAEYLKLKIMKKALDLPDVDIIVLNGRYVKAIDVTVAEVCMKRYIVATFSSALYSIDLAISYI